VRQVECADAKPRQARATAPKTTERKIGGLTRREGIAGLARIDLASPLSARRSRQGSIDIWLVCLTQPLHNGQVLGRFRDTFPSLGRVSTTSRVFAVDLAKVVGDVEEINAADRSLGRFWRRSAPRRPSTAWWCSSTSSPNLNLQGGSGRRARIPRQPPGWGTPSFSV
jgi:hypothetical protein